jgi:hypothetical protein
VSYAACYNELRTHRSLDKDAPIHRAKRYVYFWVGGKRSGVITKTQEISFQPQGRQRCPQRLAPLSALDALGIALTAAKTCIGFS